MGGVAHLTKPAANVVPSNPDDVPSLQRSTPDVVASPILQELSIAETQVVDETAIFFAGAAVRRLVCVTADKALVALADDPGLAASKNGCQGQMHG